MGPDLVTKAQENFYEEVLLQLKSKGRVGVTRLRAEGRVLQAEGTDGRTRA